MFLSLGEVEERASLSSEGAPARWGANPEVLRPKTRVSGLLPTAGLMWQTELHDHVEVNGRLYEQEFLDLQYIVLNAGNE